MIFGHPADDNPFANKLEQQAKAKVDGIEEFTRDFLDDLLRISQTILRGLAIALGQPESFFIEASATYLDPIYSKHGFRQQLGIKADSKMLENSCDSLVMLVMHFITILL